MAAAPIDFSKYANSGKQIDFSVYSQPAQASTEDSGALAGIKRGLSNIISLPASLYHAFADEPTEQEKASVPTGVPGVPDRLGLAIDRLLIQPQVNTAAKADQETPQPGDNNWNNATERAHMHKIGALIPVVGPIADNLAQRWLSGDKEGATAELATYMVAPKAVEKGAQVAPDVAAATIRTGAKTANVVLDKAPTAVMAGAGAALGHATGIPGAGEVGAVAGATLGRTLKGKLSVPGERFGLEPEYQPLPDANGPQRAPVVGVPPTPAPQPPPESGAAAEARAYFEQKLAARKAAQPPAPEPRQAPEAPQVSVADQTATAKNLGYKSLDQAKASFGEEGWNKLIGIDTPAKASQAVSDVIDKVAPNAPQAVKAEVDFQLRKGDVNAAQQALDSAKGPRESTSIDFRPSLQNAETKARALNWADVLDDKAWQEKMEADYGTDTAPAPEKNWADTFESQMAKAQQRSVPTSRQGRATYTEAVKQFIENNKVDEAKSTLGELAGQGQVVLRPQINPKR